MNYTILNDNINLKIYEANIFPCPYNEKKKMEYAMLIFAGKTKIRVKSKIKINEAVIRPLSLKMLPVIIGDEIHIEIEKPVKFSLEINGSCENNLVLFVNPPNEKAIGENLIFFKKGAHNVDVINITKDNTTIYLEDGAYVYGKIHAENVENLKIAGFGIISMENIPRDSEKKYQICIDILHCRNVDISGIIIHDSVGWSLKVSGCENCHIDNVKILGSRGNSDGVDICGSKNVLVENCFTRVWDDSFVVKAFDTGDVDNLIFRKSILWNDFARPIEVGVELRAQTVNNVVFDDIDIIHSPTGYPLLGIHHGDRAKVSNIRFSNIRIENTPGAHLFDIRITDSVWNKDEIKGEISDITFTDISVIENFMMEKSRVQGFSEAAKVRNITFHNIKFQGKTATNVQELGLMIKDYTENIIVSFEKDCLPNLIADTAIEIAEQFKLDKNGYYHGKIEIMALNNNLTEISGEIRLDIYPVNTAEYIDKALKFSLKSGEAAGKIYDVTLPAGKYGIRVGSQSPDIDSKWMFLPLDLVLRENEAICYPFTNYYNVKYDGVEILIKDNKLILNSKMPEGTPVILYTAMPVTMRKGEVKFTVEETDFGEAMAIMDGEHGLELAPQLRCPAEISYVFKNEPKVKEIVKTEFRDYAVFSFEDLGINRNAKNFWLELEAKVSETSKNRYPYTMFHSVWPDKLSHMFANVIITN